MLHRRLSGLCVEILIYLSQIMFLIIRFLRNGNMPFYRNLMSYRMKDAFRHVNPSLREYSWIGRTGDGYRYDHCFISENIIHSVKKCFYFHKPREKRLSDHSAIIAELSFIEKVSKNL